MPNFKRYPKIHRLGKEEVEDILIGECDIQEKIDGANTSIWINKDGVIACGSRSQLLQGGFNGFYEYVQVNAEIEKYLIDNPTHRLCGEWLVRHTVQYKETNYGKFYLFDIAITTEDGEPEEFLLPNVVREVAARYGIPHPHFFGTVNNPSLKELESFLGQSTLGERGEGIVIKNMGFKNKFEDLVYGKMVTQEFLEGNAITFGGNNKHSDNYAEMYIVNKYCTLPRVEKIIHKIEPTVDRKLEMQDIPRITNSVYHDIITEEMWEIIKKTQKINFGALKRLTLKKAKQIFVDILHDSISVADKNEEEN